MTAMTHPPTTSPQGQDVRIDALAEWLYFRYSRELKLRWQDQTHTGKRLWRQDAMDLLASGLLSTERLVEALRPFAEEAKRRPWLNDNLQYGIGGSRLTNLDLHNAAIAYDTAQTGKATRSGDDEHG